MVFHFRPAINAFRRRKRFFDLKQTGVKLERHVQSRPQCLVDCLSRYLSLPCGGQTERDHGDESGRLLLKNVRVQNDAGADVASASMRARIAAQQLLHRFVLDADSFLPDLRKIRYAAF
jgi:hypothetical protein